MQQPSQALSQGGHPANTHPDELVFAGSQTDKNRPLSLTNRSPNEKNGTHENMTPEPTTNDDWGLDTVRITFNTDPNTSNTSSPFWAQSSSRIRPGTATEDETYAGLLQLDHGDVRVTLYPQNNVCSLEFNPARLVAGKSMQLFNPDALGDWVELLIRALEPYVGPDFDRINPEGELRWDDDWRRQVRIRRLDIARNFAVTDPAIVMRTLPYIRPKYSQTKVEYQNKREGWTLANLTKKSGVDRIYDKTAELLHHSNKQGLAGERIFRFETQLQSDRLQKYSLRTLADVTSEAAWAALEGRWDATGWGSPLPSPTGLLEAFEGLSSALKLRMLGGLVLDENGLLEQELGHDGARRFRAKASKQKVTSGTPVRLLGKATHSLDLDAGQLMPLETENSRCIAT